MHPNICQSGGMWLAAYFAGQDQVRESWHLNSSSLMTIAGISKINFMGEGGGAAYLLDCSVPVTSAIVKTSLPATYIPYSKREQLQGFLQTVTLVSACRALLHA